MKISSINTQYNINTQYSQTDVIASIAKENANSSQSNISSVYDSSDLNLDATVVSISSNGNARMNAMLSRSIQLRASTIDPSLTPSDRQNVNKELHDIRREIEELRSKDNSKKTSTRTSELQEAMNTQDTSVSKADEMIKTSVENILKHANESIQAQNANRDHVLQLLSI